MKQKNFLLFTESLDGKTEFSNFSIKNVDILVYRIGISDFEKKDLVNQLLLSQPCIIFISTTYGDFISPIANMLSKILPDTVLILFGAIFQDCIFPPVTWNQKISNDIDYITISNTCLGFNEYMSYFIKKILPKQPSTSYLKLNINRPFINKVEDLNCAFDILPEISHLPFYYSDAMQEIHLNRYINNMIKEKFFKDKFVLVAGLPKAGSSIIGSCISVVHSKGRDTRNYGKYMQKNEDSDLRPEITKDFPTGGLVKYHTSATGKNLKVLELLGIKYIIIVREPIDQLTSIYCTYLNYSKVHPDTFLYDHIYPLFKERFLTYDEKEILSYMIQDGYLFKILSWIVDWLTFRNKDKSMIVKYENFMLHRDETLNQLAQFFHDSEASPDIISKCNSIADGYKSKSLNAMNTGKRIYPHGWSGKIDIWKDYFLEEHMKTYNRIINSFLKNYPNASFLTDIYPDLLK